MERYDFSFVKASFGRMPPWKIIAACAVNARKVAPIARVCCLPLTWELYKKCLNFTWDAWRNQRNTNIAAEARLLLDAIEAVPEWELPDNLYLSFLAAQPIDFIRLAVQAAIEEVPVEKALVSYSQILQVAENYDVAIVKISKKYIDPKEEVNLILTREEEMSQLRVIEHLSKSEVSNEVLDSLLADEVSIIAKGFLHLIPATCYSRAHSITTEIQQASW